MATRRRGLLDRHASAAGLGTAWLRRHRHGVRRSSIRSLPLLSRSEAGFSRSALRSRNLGSADPTASACIYFAGGLFFNTGGYATVLQAVNSPRGLEADGSPRYERWRWWSWEPDRIEWVSAVFLFAGTLVFGINLLDSFLRGLTVQQQNRLIWAPDLVGCTMFLISGHLALAEICHRRLCVQRRDLGWWIAALNQLGSYLFLISALAAFIRPETSSEVNAAVANWGTFGGALCFAVGGVLQVFERPTSPGSLK